MDRIEFFLVKQLKKFVGCGRRDENTKRARKSFTGFIRADGHM